MSSTSVPVIRPEMARDATQVHDVLKSAFESDSEARLVERLRAEGDIVLALVGETQGGLVGYVAFPRLTLTTDGRNSPAVGLAPVGVRPDRQRNGIGTALIRAGLARLKDRGEALIFVLGEPDYYGRFGFSILPAYESPYAGPYFQALRLTPNAPVAGVVTYPKPFSELG